MDSIRDQIGNTIRNFMWWATFTLAVQRGDGVEGALVTATMKRDSVRVFA